MKASLQAFLILLGFFFGMDSTFSQVQKDHRFILQSSGKHLDERFSDIGKLLNKLPEDKKVSFLLDIPLEKNAVLGEKEKSPLIKGSTRYTLEPLKCPGEEPGEKPVSCVEILLHLPPGKQLDEFYDKRNSRLKGVFHLIAVEGPHQGIMSMNLVPAK